MQTYSLLERDNLLVRQGIRLGDDGNKVDLGMEALHDLDIKGLQRVAGGLNEEHTSMDAVIHNVHAVHFVLGIEVRIKTLLDVVDNGPPRLVIVHKVAEARGINDSQPKANTGLLDICADGLDGDGLGNDVEAGSLALLGGIKGSVEESVNESGLSKTRFTYTQSEIELAQVQRTTYQQP